MALGRLTAGAWHTQPASTCERNISRSFRKSLTAIRTPHAEHGVRTARGAARRTGRRPCVRWLLRVDVDLHGGRRVLHVLGVVTEPEPVEGDLTDGRPLARFRHLVGPQPEPG